MVTNGPTTGTNGNGCSAPLAVCGWISSTQTWIMSFGKLVTATVAGGTGMTTITIAIISTTTICMSLNAVARR